MGSSAPASSLSPNASSSPEQSTSTPTLSGSSSPPHPSGRTSDAAASRASTARRASALIDRHPEVVATEGQLHGTPAQLDRVDHAAGPCVDSREGAVEPVGDPDVVATSRDGHRHAADVDPVGDPERALVHSGNDVVGRSGHPYRPARSGDTPADRKRKAH